MEKKALNLLLHMIELYSPSGNESEISSIVKGTMDDLGYSTSVDNVNNCIGRIGSGTPTVLLCGHLDTISPELPVYLEDGILHGRGSVDAKSSLAALIIAGKIAHEKGFSGTILVAGSVCEEGDNRGIKSIIEANMKADYAVFGEPTDTRSLSIGYKGCVVARITVSNLSGHSSAPWAYKNAIEKSMEFYNYLKEGALDLFTNSSGFDALTISIREIIGGENLGVLPRNCVMIIEFRLPPTINVKKCKEWIDEKVKTFLDKNDDEHIHYTIIDEIDPYITDKKSKLVKAFSQVIYKKFGNRVSLLKKTGTSDMNYYGRSFGVPVITYGPGESSLSHTEREKIILNDYLYAIEIISNSLLRLAELHNVT